MRPSHRGGSKQFINTRKKTEHIEDREKGVRLDPGKKIVAKTKQKKEGAYSIKGHKARTKTEGRKETGNGYREETETTLQMQD